MSKKLITIFIIIFVVLLGYWYFSATLLSEEALKNPSVQLSECETTDDFPDTCIIDPCVCPPESNYLAKACDCGMDKCFNANECVARQVQ